MSVDRYTASEFEDYDSSDGVIPPESEHQDSSEGVGGFASEEDDGDEEKWAREQDREKVGRRLGLENVSKASDDFRYLRHNLNLFAPA
jgi:hypothetical protein